MKIEQSFFLNFYPKVNKYQILEIWEFTFQVLSVLSMSPDPHGSLTYQMNSWQLLQSIMWPIYTYQETITSMLSLILKMPR